MGFFDLRAFFCLDKLETMECVAYFHIKIIFMLYELELMFLFLSESKAYVVLTHFSPVMSALSFLLPAFTYLELYWEHTMASLHEVAYLFC